MKTILVNGTQEGSILYETRTSKKQAEEKLLELQNLEFRIIALARKLKKNYTIEDSMRYKAMFSEQSLKTREYCDFTYVKRNELKSYKRN